MTTFNKLTVAQLRRAVSIKEQIEELQAELASLLGDGDSTPAIGRGGNHMSAAGRARIAAAQKARWAKVKAGEGNDAPKKRRKLSAEGRARIAAAAKARWAKARAAGKNRL